MSQEQVKQAVVDAISDGTIGGVKESADGQTAIFRINALGDRLSDIFQGIYAWAGLADNPPEVPSAQAQAGQIGVPRKVFDKFVKGLQGEYNVTIDLERSIPVTGPAKETTPVAVRVVEEPKAPSPLAAIISPPQKPMAPAPLRPVAPTGATPPRKPHIPAPRPPQGGTGTEGRAR